MRIANCAVAVGLLGSALLLAAPAQAGLLGAGRTVQAFYYNGSLAGTPEGEIAVGALTSDPASLIAPVSYQQGAADGSTIDITDVRIVITNRLSNAPFCLLNTPGTSCTDSFDGFDFLFTGENILGVSVNPSSAVGMLPVSGTFQGNTHLGLQLLSNNHIRIDLTGDLPLLGDSLVLDLSFQTAPPPLPEPGTLSLLAIAFVGLTSLRRRRI